MILMAVKPYIQNGCFHNNQIILRSQIYIFVKLQIHSLFSFHIQFTKLEIDELNYKPPLRLLTSDTEVPLFSDSSTSLKRLISGILVIVIAVLFTVAVMLETQRRYRL